MLGGERWVSICKALALQNTPKATIKQQKKTHKTNFKSLTITRIFSPYLGYVWNWYIFTGITKIPGQTAESAINQE